MKNVKIYTWKMCPFCLRAKQLLKKENIEYEEIKIDGDESALDALKSRTGIRSVPQIFVDDEFIGGCDDLFALRDNGTFDDIMKGKHNEEY